MICSVLNLTKEYSGITDVNCYLLFVDLEKKDSIEKVQAIINYAKDNCKIGKKIFIINIIFIIMMGITTMYMFMKK